MAKVKTEEYHLVSTSGSGHFYTYRRNKKKGKGNSKLEIKKYDPVVRKSVLYVEGKLKPIKISRQRLLKTA